MLVWKDLLNVMASARKFGREENPEMVTEVSISSGCTRLLYIDGAVIGKYEAKLI
jgi:hypothetical protein